MNDNMDEKLDSLFAAARSVRADTSAGEEHFETRLMARLRERREGSQPWYFWTWRLAPVFMVIVIILGVSNMVIERDSSSDIFSVASNDHSEYQIVGYMEED